MAPKADILLVETPVTETEGVYGFPQIVAAENYVIDRHLGEVISQSFGAPEQTFTSPGQIYSLRSRQSPAGESYPGPVKPLRCSPASWLWPTRWPGTASAT
jgi:hypothetical protein